MAAVHQHIEFSARGTRDLRALQARERDRIVEALGGLVSDPPAENLDIRPLTGRAPWLRLRVGNHRVIYRPLTEAEQTRLVLQRGALEGNPAFLVMRVVDRRDLSRVVRTLEASAD